MLSILETVLFPIVWVMQFVLEFYIFIFSSTGAAILLLSFTFSLLLTPLRGKADGLSKRIGAKMNAANDEVRALKPTLKGEALFLATEKIYRKHGYHPIQNIGIGASFFVMLPVLISAILLFSGDSILAGKSFLGIDDLSKPDGLIGGMNVLPIVMSGITVVDARLRFKDNRKAQFQFYFIAAVLLALVYNLSSGLVIYWTGSNIMALVLGIFPARALCSRLMPNHTDVGGCDK